MAADISHFQFQPQRCGKYALSMDVRVCIGKSWREIQLLAGVQWQKVNNESGKKA